ncbi:hypothetical protein Smar_1506 [Staphylothermus marinus F1]|uniref:Uncharacterized protein n=1 Tax=Staphylothermus marinus (strain ATCC 43588 / DSM 3639 / JCM 9404 / F1) TaxID=399550 RepID=A3DPN5_STAMF|nr:hypothetical protein [Staphylothermus marinus]ABN70595.1 hypothetical protein Smar_1506 [Staphylothermus marinus F1]
MSEHHIWSHGEIWIKILATTIVIELGTIGFYVIGRYTGFLKSGTISPLESFLEIVLLSTLFLLFIISYELLRQTKISNISFYQKYFALFFSSLGIAVLIELFEDSGIVQYNMFPYALINDVLIVIILASFFDFVYDLMIISGTMMKRKLLESPLTLLSLFIVLIPIVVFFVTLTISNNPITLDAFTIGDILIGLFFIIVLAHYLIKVYNFVLYIELQDYGDIVNAMILLIIGYNVGDIIDNFLYKSQLWVIYMYFTFDLSLILALLTIVFNGLFNLLRTVEPFILRKTLSNFHILINTSIDDPITFNSRIFSMIRLYLDKIRGVKNKILLVIGELNTLQKIILRATLGNIQVINVNIKEYGGFTSRTGVKDEIINIIEYYEAAASPTHILGILNEVVDKYSDKQVIVLYNTLTDLILMMGVRRAYLTLRSILLNKELSRRITGSFYVIIEDAHEARDIELFRNIIPRVIRL